MNNEIVNANNIAIVDNNEYNEETFELSRIAPNQLTLGKTKERSTSFDYLSNKSLSPNGKKYSVDSIVISMPKNNNYQSIKSNEQSLKIIKYSNAGDAKKSEPSLKLLIQKDECSHNSAICADES